MTEDGAAGSACSHPRLQVVLLEAVHLQEACGHGHLFPEPGDLLHSHRVAGSHRQEHYAAMVGRSVVEDGSSRHDALRQLPGQSRASHGNAPSGKPDGHLGQHFEIFLAPGVGQEDAAALAVERFGLLHHRPDALAYRLQLDASPRSPGGVSQYSPCIHGTNRCGLLTDVDDAVAHPPPGGRKGRRHQGEVRMEDPKKGLQLHGTVPAQH